MPSDSNYLKRMRDHYAERIPQHGNSHLAVDWGSRESQLKRFEVLCSVADLSEQSILDLGCGTGSLFEYLKNNGFRGTYQGIDILEEMVSEAKKSHPTADFMAMDIDDLPVDREYDYVLCSGIFTFMENATFQQTIRSMFSHCTKGIAFNALSSWGNEQEEGEFHPNPLATAEFCHSLSPNLSLRHDYLPHDFSIFLYRQQ